MGSVEGVIEQLDAPVLVVGGGPVGLLSAYMLSKLGSEYSTPPTSHVITTFHFNLHG